MEALSPPRGLIVELITPFEQGGSIDGSGLKKLLGRVSSSVQGVFLASPRAGEGISLSPDLRADLLNQTILAMESDPVPIFIWVTQASEEKTRETLLALDETVRSQQRKVDLFYVDSPLYYHSNRGLPDLYTELCAVAEAPLVLLNDPHLVEGLGAPFKRNNIRTAVFKELVGVKRISGMIFSGSLDRAHHYQRACRQRPDFRLYDGDEGRFLDYPIRSGVVSMGANLAPAAWQRIVQFSIQSSAKGADYPDRLQQVWETGDNLRRMHGLYATAPAPLIKHVLAQEGVIAPPLEPSRDMQTQQIALKEFVAQMENESNLRNLL